MFLNINLQYFFSIAIFNLDGKKVGCSSLNRSRLILNRKKLLSLFLPLCFQAESICSDFIMREKNREQSSKE